MCSICHHEERSRYLIDKHIAKHSDKPEESFRCDKCSFVGLNKRSLQYHQKKHEEKYYFCGKCNNLSQTKAQLQSHTWRTKVKVRVLLSQVSMQLVTEATYREEAFQFQACEE